MHLGGEILDLAYPQECLVCVAEFWIALVEKRPIKIHVPTRVEHGGYDRWSAEAICNIIGAALLVLDVQMELLQVCGPFMMVIVLQLCYRSIWASFPMTWLTGHHL